MKPIGSKVVALLFALALVVTLGAAESENYWQPGSGVQVGGVYFHVVSVAPDSEALFRVGQRLDAPGAQEHPDCYRVSRTFYHRESCPVVQEHFRRHAPDAGTAAPAPAQVSRAGGSHPINYVQGNYEAPAAPFWSSTGLWYSPWLSFGHRYGHNRFFTRHRGLGVGARPGARPLPSGAYGRGHGGGFSFHARW